MCDRISFFSLPRKGVKALKEAAGKRIISPFDERDTLRDHGRSWGGSWRFNKA